MWKFTENKKADGSISVEAALVFPAFILFLLPFIFLLRVQVLQSVLETAMQSVAEEVATKSYLIKKTGVLSDESSDGMSGGQESGNLYPVPDFGNKKEELQDLLDSVCSFLEPAEDDVLQNVLVDLAGAMVVKEMLRQKIPEDVLMGYGAAEGWDSVSTLGTKLFYEESGHRYLMELTCSVTLNKIVPFWQMEDIKVTRVIHAFMGESEETALHNGKTSVDEEELVYQIGKGIHYHQLSCYLIRKEVKTGTKQAAEKLGLSPCSRCLGGSGATVYYTDGGTHYHAYGCEYLFPDLTPMSLDEAIGKGLTSCGLCFGGKGELFH